MLKNNPWLTDTERRQRVLITVIILAAWALRLGGLDRLSLWIDEGYTVARAALTPHDIVASASVGQHPPLYHLLLHGWLHLAGQSVFSIRFLSALFGLAVVPLLFRIGRPWGAQVGLVAAGLLALSPPHIWYSQEARMYTLLVLLGTFSTWLAWRWWADNRARTRSRTALYVLTTLAMAYTHHFGLFLVACQNVIGLTVMWRQAKKERFALARRWLALQALWVAGYLPWFSITLNHTLADRMVWISLVTWAAVRNSWIYLLYGAAWLGHWTDVVGAILGLGLTTLALVRSRSEKPGRTRDPVWIALWFWIPAAAIVAASSRLHIYQDKQLLVILPPLLLLVALGLYRIRNRWLWGAGVLAVLLLLANPLRWMYAEALKQDWRGLAAHVDAHAQPGDLVYFQPATIRWTFDYYSSLDLDRSGYPPDHTLLKGGWEGTVATGDVVDEQLGGLAPQHARIWLVEFYPELWDPNGVIEAWFDRHCQSLETIDFAGVSLTLCTLAPDAGAAMYAAW